MMVDIPQPLHVRYRAHSRRGSFDGPAIGQNHSGELPRSTSHGANLTLTTSDSYHAGFTSQGSGGGAAGTRRMSRSMSRTVIVDQDWQGAAGSGAGSGGPAPAALPGGAFETAEAAVAIHAGADGAFMTPLHVPGPGSRRASRTLSGGVD
jgi:hypothetical protein